MWCMRLISVIWKIELSWNNQQIIVEKFYVTPSFSLGDLFTTVNFVECSSEEIFN